MPLPLLAAVRRRTLTRPFSDAAMRYSSLRLLPHPGRGGAGNVTVGSDQPQPVFADRRTKLGIGSMLEETLNEVMSALRFAN